MLTKSTSQVVNALQKYLSVKWPSVEKAHSDTLMSAIELRRLFNELPEALLCFAIGHVRQVDPSMTEAVLILREFKARLAEVHISEVNTSSRHDPISTSAVQAFRSVAGYIALAVPIIVESLIDQGQSDILTEIESAREVLSIGSPALVA